MALQLGELSHNHAMILRRCNFEDRLECVKSSESRLGASLRHYSLQRRDLCVTHMLVKQIINMSMTNSVIAKTCSYANHGGMECMSQ